MMIQKSYKFKFTPNAAQAEQLQKEFGCARWAWNRGLIERDYAYSQWGVSLGSLHDIGKNINQYKKNDYPWLSDATSSVYSAKANRPR